MSIEMVVSLMTLLLIMEGVSNRRTDERSLPLFEKLDPDVTKVDAEYYREKLERADGT